MTKTTQEKIELAIDGLDIIVAGLKSTTTQLGTLTETAREMVKEWERFQEEVPHQTGEFSR